MSWTIGKLRGQLYRGARDLGNVEAATNGYKRDGVEGAAIGEAKRVARRKVYRTTNRGLGRILRKVGLQ
jgi:hypothetical protein